MGQSKRKLIQHMVYQVIQPDLIFHTCCIQTFYSHCEQKLLQDGEKKGVAKGLRTVVGERFGDEAVKGDGQYSTHFKIYI